MARLTSLQNTFDVKTSPRKSAIWDSSRCLTDISFLEAISHERTHDTFTGVIKNAAWHCDTLARTGIQLDQANVKNTELGTIRSIVDDEMTVQLDKGRQVTVPLNHFRHCDHGYAVTSYSSQAQTVDRVLLNAETTETDLLLNQRMAYVALSRGRLDAHVYTDSAANLGEALDRQQNKEIALDALHESQVAASITAASRAANTQGPNPDYPAMKAEHLTAADITRTVIKRPQLSVQIDPTIDPTSNLQQSTESSLERARQALDRIAAESSLETHLSTTQPSQPMLKLLPLKHWQYYCSFYCH